MNQQLLCGLAAQALFQTLGGAPFEGVFIGRDEDGNLCINVPIGAVIQIKHELHIEHDEAEVHYHRVHKSLAFFGQMLHDLEQEEAPEAYFDNEE